jgi:2-oxoglutarate ferredoxin oxidoreductase subunit alpha
VEFPDHYEEPPLPAKEWAATGAKGRNPQIIKSLFLDPEMLEKNSLVLNDKYERMKHEEVRFELYNVNSQNSILIVSYGTMARICQTAIDELEAVGVSVGLLRPITLFPFPQKEIKAEAKKKNIKAILTVEMSMGQMLEDVRQAVLGAKPTEFYGRTGGIVPSPDEVKEQVIKLIEPKARPSKSRK